MKIRSLAPAWSLLFWMTASSLSQAADKITISYSSRSYAFLPAQVALARGFYKDENRSLRYGTFLC